MYSQPRLTPWEELYRAAVLETSIALLPQRIDVARTALSARLQEIKQAPDLIQERSRLECALNMLELLKRVELRRTFHSAA